METARIHQAIGAWVVEKSQPCTRAEAGAGVAEVQLLETGGSQLGTVREKRLAGQSDRDPTARPTS